MNLGKYVFNEPYFGWLLNGIGNTLLISFLSGSLALLLGILLTSSAKPQGKPSTFSLIFTDIFRNIPPVPMLLLLSIGLPQIFSKYFHYSLPSGFEFKILILGLSFNTAAYISEILIAGLRGVPTKQYEAGVSLGLGRMKIFFLIQLPQAFRISFPAISTRLIHNMKNSSVALVIPLNLDRMELMGQTSRIAGQTFAWAEPLLFSTAIYLVLAYALSVLLARISAIIDRKVNPDECN